MPGNGIVSKQNSEFLPSELTLQQGDVRCSGLYWEGFGRKHSQMSKWENLCNEICIRGRQRAGKTSQQDVQKALGLGVTGGRQLVV